MELISWIASINDKGMLEKLYSVKKAMEPKKAATKKTAFTEALALLDEITQAYSASSEPDLNISQIFTDRTKTDGRATSELIIQSGSTTLKKNSHDRIIAKTSHQISATKMAEVSERNSGSNCPKVQAAPRVYFGL